MTGPLLLYKDSLSTLGKDSFTTKRHPRTAIGINDQYAYLLTVDGRQDTAAGMSLIELQDFMRQLGCTTAVNLDGGGKYDAWVRGKRRGQSPE